MQAIPEGGLTTTQLIAVAAVSSVALGWVVAALGKLLQRDRITVDKQDEESKRQILALWKAQDEIKKILDTARRDIAVIDDRLQNTLPDMHHYDSKLEALRIELGAKVDMVIEKIHLTQVTLAKLTPDD